ncbi:MAG: LysM peptidoglycan-binding domain-containing protein [Verrucomicrobia bacterium]|nr:LysM peptidoglycan-binding domain-containing protein [Verrucomicrobiota bacterium]
MDGKSVCGWLIAIVAGASAVLAQDKGSVATRDLEAIKAQLKAQQERIDKLSQQVNKLNDAIRQQRPATPPPPPPPPPAPPAPAVAASPTPNASTNAGAAAPATVGVERALPVEPANTRTHTVARGETLTQIAKQFGVTVEDIEHLNKIGDAKKLQAGQTIKIPPPANSANPAQSPSPADQP